MHKACKGKDSKERSQLLYYLIEKGGNINLQSKVNICMNIRIVNTNIKWCRYVRQQGNIHRQGKDDGMQQKKWDVGISVDKQDNGKTSCLKKYTYVLLPPSVYPSIHFNFTL